MDTFNAATASNDTTRSSSAYDFVKGFITGQVALLALLLLMVRLLFFRSAGAVVTPTTIKLDSRAITKKKITPIPLNTTSNDSLLLERLFGLNHLLLKQESIKSGCPEVLISDESARWLTFLLAKLVVDPLRERLASTDDLANHLKSSLTAKLSGSKYVDLDEMSFKGLGLGMGQTYPVIDSYQLVYDAQRESCAFRVRCTWQDVFHLEVESALRLAGLISLPFALNAQARTLRFTAQLGLTGDGEVHVFCLPDDNFLLELEIGSLVGHRTKLKDLPKITAGMVEVIKKVLTDSLIYPRSLKFKLPNDLIGVRDRGVEVADEAEVSEVDVNESKRSERLEPLEGSIHNEVEDDIASNFSNNPTNLESDYESIASLKQSFFESQSLLSTD